MGRCRQITERSIGSPSSSSTAITGSPSAVTNPPSTPRSAPATFASRRARSSSSARTASLAAFTAPPDTSVCRDAEVDPAEPTSVSEVRRITRSTPSTVRAICAMIVWTPCPTSAAALWISATGPSGPAESVTRASA